MLRRILSTAFALVVILELLPLTAIAHGSRYVVKLYNESNGLPTGEANDVIQTSDGYIWIGSYGGLIRYDGTSFVNYSINGRINSSSIRGLFEDSRRRLWIGTNDAGIFVLENGEITAVPCSTDGFLCVRDFAEGLDGTIYAASNSGAAWVVDGVLTPLSGEHAQSGTVYSIDIDSKGRAWCSTNAGLAVVFEGGEEVKAFSSDDFFPDERLYCTGSDNHGNIYIGSSESTVVKLSFSGTRLEEKNIAKEVCKTDGVATVNAIKPAGNGSVLICGNIGACLLQSDGSQIVFSEYDSAESVNSGTVDYEGNIWLASASFGIIKYTQGCYETPNRAAGLSGVPLNALVKQDGLYYCATDKGVLCFDEDWNSAETPLSSLYDGIRVRCLAADGDGNVWAATYSSQNSLASYNPESGEIKAYSTDDGLLSSNVRTVCPLSDGRLAIGTQGGLNIIRNGEIVESYGADEGLLVPTILCTVETAEGSILAGSDGGGIYEIKDGEVISHYLDEGLEDGVVLRILQDGEQNYFVSAGSSLYYQKGGRFERIDIQKGAGSIFDMYLRDEKLWIVQNSGIYAYDYDSLMAGEKQTPVVHGMEHGLSGSVNANTWNWVDPEDGRLYLVTRSGISIFGFGQSPTIKPKGALNSISVDGAEYKVRDKITLPKDANRVTLDFAALTFTGTTSVGMTYLLEGFDAEPTVVIGKNAGTVSYTNLPGGEYTFRLSFFDANSPEKRTEIVLRIKKEKQIYEHPAFIYIVILLAIFLAAGIVFIISRIKIRAMQNRQREYQDIIDQSLQTFARAIDAKDRYTNGHSQRVAEYSRELAKRLGLSGFECEKVYYIGLLHDIGKIGIPDNILNKAGKLTDEEFDIIRRHPMIGGEILKQFTAIDGIADGAKYHHERIDGNGYNSGLKGDEIPLIARIIGVADTFDAMSSNRCYRPAQSADYIMSELKRVSGTQLDSQIVQKMIEMISDGVAPLADNLHSEASDISRLYQNDL